MCYALLVCCYQLEVVTYLFVVVFLCSRCTEAHMLVVCVLIQCMSIKAKHLGQIPKTLPAS